MSGSINKAIIIGRLGKDVEVRHMPSGGKMATFSVATSETWNDKVSNEKKERTEWHRIAVFHEKLVDFSEKYLKKGMRVYIEGQIQTRKWTDQQGGERYTTEIVLQGFRGAITMLETKAESAKNTHDFLDTAKAQQQPTEQKNIDDDIPF